MRTPPALLPLPALRSSPGAVTLPSRVVALELRAHGRLRSPEVQPRRHRLTFREVGALVCWLPNHEGLAHPSPPVTVRTDHRVITSHSPPIFHSRCAHDVYTPPRTNPPTTPTACARTTVSTLATRSPGPTLLIKGGPRLSVVDVCAVATSSASIRGGCAAPASTGATWKHGRSAAAPAIDSMQAGRSGAWVPHARRIFVSYPS